jgi:hypothetical protein
MILLRHGVGGGLREGNGRRTVRPPILNSGSGVINGEDASKVGDHGSQRARFPVRLRSVQLACFSVRLHIGGQLARLMISLRSGLRSHASRSVKQLSARHLLAIKSVMCGVT